MEEKNEQAMNEFTNRNMSEVEKSKVYERVKIEEEFKQKIRTEKPKLTRFLDFTFPDFDLERAEKNIQDNLENKLYQNIQKRLFRETFLTLESHILKQRLTKISHFSKQLLVNCVQCQQKIAEVQCEGCDLDFFCQNCFESVHEAEAFKKHKFKVLKS